MRLFTCSSSDKSKDNSTKAQKFLAKWISTFVYKRKASSDKRTGSSSDIWFSQEEMTGFPVPFFESHHTLGVAKENLQVDNSQFTEQVPKGNDNAITPMMPFMTNVEFPDDGGLIPPNQEGFSTSLLGNSQAQGFTEINDRPETGQSTVQPVQEADPPINISAILASQIAEQLGSFKTTMFQQLEERLKSFTPASSSTPILASEAQSHIKATRDPQGVVDNQLPNERRIRGHSDQTYSPFNDSESEDEQQSFDSNQEYDSTLNQRTSSWQQNDPVMETDETLDQDELADSLESETTTWYRVPKLHQLVGTPPALIWNNELYTTDDVCIQEHNNIKIFKVVKSSMKVMSLIRHCSPYDSRRSASTKSISSTEALLNPIRSNAAQDSSNWFPQADGRLKITLSSSSKNTLLKPKRAFDDEDDLLGSAQKTTPLKLNMFSEEPESSAVLRCLYSPKMVKESMSFDAPLHSLCSALPAHYLDRELEKRKIVANHLVASEGLAMSLSLLKPEFLAKFTSIADLNSHISLVANALGSVQGQLQFLNEKFCEDWIKLKKWCRARVMQNTEHSFAKNAINMDIYTRGLWSSSQIKTVNEEALKRQNSGSGSLKRQARPKEGPQERFYTAQSRPGPSFSNTQPALPTQQKRQVQQPFRRPRGQPFSRQGYPSATAKRYQPYRNNQPPQQGAFKRQQSSVQRRSMPANRGSSTKPGGTAPRA